MPSPEWWLERLTHRLDHARPKISWLRRYLEGDAPLPDGAEGCREAYKAFQKKARSNYAELVTEAVAERMVVSGFRVGDSNEDDDLARSIWKRNRLGMWSTDVHRDMIGLRAGFVCAQRDPFDDSKAEITYERPEQVMTDHDPSRPDRVRAALKVYRDDVEGFDAAYVHWIEDGQGWVERFVRKIPINKDGIPQPMLTVTGQWEPLRDDGERIGPQPTGLKTVPIIPFVNRGARGEFETHIDLLDRINFVTLQRLVITAMQAFRQRATKGELDETDENGNRIDYGAIFKPGPGALWHLPEGVDLWESQITDIRGILDAAKEDVRELAAVTRTPAPMLIPDNANQTAEGAASAKEGLFFKVGDRIERAAPSWGVAMGLSMQIEQGLPEPPEVDVQFKPPEHQSLSERMDALSKASTELPWRTKMTRIMGFDGDEVDRMATERAEDLLTAFANAPAAPAPAAPPGDLEPVNGP